MKCCWLGDGKQLDQGPCFECRTSPGAPFCKVAALASTAHLTCRTAALACPSQDSPTRCTDKHQRSEVLRQEHIQRIRAKAGNETRKVRVGGRSAMARAG